jgi:hypothetical protein
VKHAAPVAGSGLFAAVLDASLLGEGSVFPLQRFTGLALVRIGNSGPDNDRVLLAVTPQWGAVQAVEPGKRRVGQGFTVLKALV